MHYLKKLIFACGLAAFIVVFDRPASGQIQIPTSPPPATENFDIGTSATAPLPQNFKADNPAAERTVRTFAGAVSNTNQRGGNALPTNAANGIYNFGAGDPATATDRAVGFLSSGTATKSGNLYVQLQAPVTSSIASLNLGYDIEKYRNGTNPAGFRIQLFYSYSDAAGSYVDAGSTFNTFFPADANITNNTGFTPAPGVTVPVTGTLTLPTPIEAGSLFYLAFNYSVPTGTTTSNAQALAVDNFSVQGVAAVPEPGTTLLFGAAAATLLLGRWRFKLPVGAASVFSILLAHRHRRT